MQPIPVVELDIADDGHYCLNIMIVDLVVNELSFQCAKEAFHGCVVERVAFAAHTSHKTSRLQQQAVVVRRVFKTLLAMDQTAVLAAFSIKCHSQRTLGEFGISLWTK